MTSTPITTAESAPPTITALQLRFDETDECWLGDFGVSDAAGTSQIDLPGLWLEFDRLRPARLVSASVHDGVDPEVKRVVDELLGRMPESASESIWRATLSRPFALKLWNVAEGLADLTAWRKLDDVTAALLMLETAAAIEDARDWVPDYYLTAGPSPTEISVAAETLRNTKLDALPRFARLGVDSLLDRFAPRTTPASRKTHRSAVSAFDVAPIVEADTPIDFEVVGSDLVVNARSGDLAGCSVFVECGDELVGAAVGRDGPVTVPLASFGGRAVLPDRIVVRSSPLLDAFREAVATSDEARRLEVQGELVSAGERWHDAAQAWVCAGSSTRAAYAFVRSAGLSANLDRRSCSLQIAEALSSGEFAFGS
ncbi:MAG: hypothetical protein Q8K63_14365, partial [Acidimicrobiales bacterium]|nr:hypothetical protein [Acidimicrobiales bacterium]